MLSVTIEDDHDQNIIVRPTLFLSGLGWEVMALSEPQHVVGKVLDRVSLHLK